MAGYLTHPEPRLFLFFFECGPQGSEKLVDLVRIIFLSDLPTQIPDSFVIYSGHAGENFLPKFRLFNDVKVMAVYRVVTLGQVP